jgi:hypothetical protein
MWPLHLLLLLGLSGPQQNSPNSSVILQGKLSAVQKLHSMAVVPERIFDPNSTCYTMRSYFFRRQDGLAPVPAGMTTCTPASVLQQKRVSPGPRVRFVPLGAQQDQQK